MFVLLRLFGFKLRIKNIFLIFLISIIENYWYLCSDNLIKNSKFGGSHDILIVFIVTNCC